MGDSIHDRGRAMEDLFFQQKDQQLLEKLKSELSMKESRDQLEQASGIHDRDVLNQLIEHGVTVETLLSVGMIPLVAVAWADNVLQPAERKSIMQAAESSGIAPDSTAYKLLESWLQERPDRSLLVAWELYIKSLKSQVDVLAFNQLKSQVLDRAEKVADSAGGFLGMGNRVSEAERRVLNELKAVFES